MSHDPYQPYGQQPQGPYPQQPYGQPPPYGQQPYGQQRPQPSQDTLAASANHWGALVVNLITGFLGFVVPLVILLTLGTRSPFVRAHATESLNFQISLVIYGIGWLLVSVVIGVLTLGLGLLVVIPLLLAWVVALFVFTILASIKAANGEPYRYPLILRFVR